MGFCVGGESGIRTRGGLLTHTRFPGVRLKPLIHLSRQPAIVAATGSIFQRLVGASGVHANRLSVSRSTCCKVLACVASSTTGGATPASSASSQRLTHRHHRSPGLRPAKRHWGRGVIKSLPRSSEKRKKSSVTRAHNTWVPRSSGPVWQQPSRKKPVNGSYEQACNGPPSTLSASISMIHWRWVWIIFMAEEIRVPTSVMLLGTTSVVVASAASRP